jgi:hypothetical protein
MGSLILSRLSVLARTSDLPIALGLFLICCITRLLAFPASFWEWDDILFAQALHQYDLINNYPHPPGFPVFVAMGRLAYWLLNDEQLALSTVSLSFTSLLGPALFYFYREIFNDRRVAFAGALLGSFAPNVWVHSGAGRSDGVALTLGIIGLTLVIHGLESKRSLILGCAVFGLAMGVRVTLLPVMGPVIAAVFLIRLWRRDWKTVAMALGTGTVFVLLWFIPFIYLVSWRLFQILMKNHSEYAWTTDSIIANNENGRLSYRLGRFLIQIWGSKWIMLAIYTLSALGLIALALNRRWQAIGWLALAFLPFLTFTLVLNTPLSAPLYSLPYIPLFIGLAACGLIMAPRLFEREGDKGAFNNIFNNIGLYLALVLTIGIASWSYPIIKLLHNEAAPSIQATRYLRQTLDYKHDVLFFDEIFLPHANFYLGDSRKIMLRDDQTIPESDLINPLTDWSRFIGLTSNPSNGEAINSFSWTSSEVGKRRLRRLSLGRYFEAYVSDMSKSRGVLFLSGWYPQEHDEARTWRWMGMKARVGLLNKAETMVLRLQGDIKLPPKSNRQPNIVFRFNGAEVDRFTAVGSALDRTIVLKPDPARQWSELTIETDQAFNPSRDESSADDRDLGIQCFALEWSPAPGGKPNNQSPEQYLGTGWYELETNRIGWWRVTNGSASAHLPAVEGEARLDLRMQALPQDEAGTIPELAVEVGGNIIEKFQPTRHYLSKTYYVPASIHHDKQTELRLLAAPIDSTKPRPRALVIFYLGWRPSERENVQN